MQFIVEPPLSPTTHLYDLLTGCQLVSGWSQQNLKIDSNAKCSITSHIPTFCMFWWVLTFDLSTVKCHYNACHYNANASLTRSSLGSQTAPTCPHDHPRVAQHMGYRCEIIAVWSATAAMTPLGSHTNGIKQRYPTCWLCQYSRFMIDLRSNTLIIHLRCSENAINRPIWLPDARMLKTISVAIKLT